MSKTFLILTSAYAAQTVTGNEYNPRNQNELFLSRRGNPHAIQEVKSKTLLTARNTDVTSALLTCKADAIKMTTEPKTARKKLADPEPDGQTK
jgi:hypothetical protein